MSIPISQFILPLFLPLVTMFLLYIYVSILQVGLSIPFFYRFQVYTSPHARLSGLNLGQMQRFP